MDRTRLNNLIKHVMEQAVATRSQQSAPIPTPGVRPAVVAPNAPPQPMPIQPRIQSPLQQNQMQRLQELLLGGRQPAQPQAAMGPQQNPMLSRADLMAQDARYQQAPAFPEPPAGYQGVPWEQVPPEQQATIWEQYDGSTPAMPQYESSGTLRVREGAPGQQNRAYANPSATLDPVTRYKMGLAPQDENGHTPPGWDTKSQAERENIWRIYADATGINLSTVDTTANPNMGGPPPGITQAAWNEMTPEQRTQAWVEQQTVDPGIIGDIAKGGAEPTQRAWSARKEFFDTLGEAVPDPVKTALNYDPFQDNEIGRGVNTKLNRVTDTFMNVLGKPLEMNMEQQADATYYMMTHDGQMPSDWGDWGTYSARLFGGNALVPDELEPIDYLMNHRELWPEAQKVYEDAEKAGENGAAALVTWYYTKIGPWWTFAAQNTNDPLNIIMLLGIPAAQLKSRAIARATVAKGTEAQLSASRALKAAEVLKAASDPLGYPIEKIIGKATRWTQRIPEGEAAARRTAQESSEQAETTASDLFAGDPERQMRARKEAQAQADLDATRATAAADEERAAQQQIRSDIQAGNQRRMEADRIADERARTAQEQVRAEQRTAQQDARRQGELDTAKRNYDKNLKLAQTRRDAAIDRASTPKAKENAARTYKQRIDEARINYEADQARVHAKYGATAPEVPFVNESAATTGRTAQDIFDDTIGLKDPLPDNVQAAVDANRDVLSNRQRTEREIPVQDVPSDARIVATQDELIPDTLQEYIDNPNLESTADMPIAVKDGDTYYVIEGTHRTGGARVRGDATIPMRVIETAPTEALTPTPPPRPIENYYGPDYVTKSGQPNLARMVQDTYGPRNPEAARRFWDAYAPMTERQVAADERLAAEQAAKGVPAGIERDTVERAIRQTEFNAQADALFELHFGEAPPRRTYRRYDANGRMDPTDPRSWIEHAVFGDSPQDSANAIARIRNAPEPILAGRNNADIADWADARARLREGDLPAAEIATSPTTPSAPTDVSPLPKASRTAVPEEIKARILDPDPAVSKAARAEAYRIPGVDRNEVNALREQAGHPKTERVRKPKGAPGIVLDPWEASAPYADSTRRMLGQVTDPVRPWKPRPPTVVGNLSVPGHVQHADALAESIKSNVRVTQRQIDEMTDQVTITVGSGKNAKEITTNYWDRVQDNLDAIGSKRKSELSTTGYPKTPEGQQALYDAYENAYKEAIAQTHEEFASLWAPRKARGMEKVVGRQMAGLRGRLQFNAVTGVRNLLVDNITNMWRTALHGEVGAFRTNYQTFATLLTKDAEKFDAFSMPLFDRLRKQGIAHLPKDLRPTIGREEVERVLAGGKGKYSIFENYLIKKSRQVNDTATRYAIYANHFNRNIAFEQAKWMDFVRAKVRKGAPETMFEQLRSMAMKGDFSPDDIRAITSKFGADDSYARTWAKQVDDLQLRANQAQNRVMFSYKKTKIDDQLGKVFLFHYFMTRQSADYVRLMLQHPQLINYEARLWQLRGDIADQFPGMPDWMQHGFFGFAIDHGHALYTNPTMMISGLATFASIGDEGFSRSKLEGVLNSTNLFLNPVWQAAAAITGYFGMRDPTGTRQIERFVTATWDHIRFSDWGREHGLAQSGDQPSPDWITDVVNGISDYVNEKAREKLPYLKDFDDTTSTEYKRDAVEGILITNAEEEGWTEERLHDAQLALYAGDANPDVDDAVNEYADMAFKTGMGNVAIPGGVYVRDAQTDARKVRQKESAAVDPGLRTPEQEKDAETRQTEQLRSGEAVALHEDLNQYQAIGDDREKHIAAGRQQMIYNYADVPDDYQLKLNGRVVTGAELKAMNDDEREALYDEWAGAQTRAPGMDPLDQYDTERKAMREENPTVGDVSDYRKYVGQQEDAGTLRQFRDDLLAAGDNTEFAQAYQEKRSYLQDQGYTGTHLDDEMDKWMGSEEAYAALMGWQYRSHRHPGAAMFSARDPAPWRETDAGGGGAPAEPKGQAVDEGIDLATVTPEQVESRLRDDAISDDALRQLVTDGRITEDDIRQWQRDGVVLDENIYAMAAKPNLPASEIKYMVEDGYMTIAEARALIFETDEDAINAVRRTNRKRKSDKENKVGPYAPKTKKSSGAYYPSMMQDFLLAK